MICPVCINNSNLGEETTEETLLDSLDFVERLCKATDLELWMHTAVPEVAEKLSELPIMPMKLQKKFFSLS